MTQRDGWTSEAKIEDEADYQREITVVERAEDVIFQRDRIIKVSLAEEIEEECRVPNVDTAEWSFWQVFGLLAPASVWYAVVEPRGVDVQNRAVSTPTDPVRIENAISLPY